MLKPDRADLAGHLGAAGEEVGRAGDVLRGLVHRQAHQQPAGLVRLGGRPAVVEVGREGDEAGVGEAVRDRGDVRDEAPPLLDHDDGGRAAGAGGHGEVALAGARRCSR